MTDVAPRPTGGMLELLNGFVVELRNAGLPVSLTENLDAMEAVQYIPIDDREAFKYALAATMVKNQSHWKAFETVFEIYFSLRGEDLELDADGNPIGDSSDVSSPPISWRVASISLAIIPSRSRFRSVRYR